jgi:tRNA (guanosine-2'-O-)-methyltransferase
MDTAETIKTLSEIVTPERLAKLNTVLDQRTRYLSVALEDVFQGHNAAAVLRSCECFGVQDIHCIELRNAFKPSDEVAMGSEKWLSLYRYNSTEAALKTLKAQGYQIVATTLEPPSIPLAEIPLDKPTVLLFGTELKGLSPAAHEMADIRAYLPMVGFTQSFNISVSVALSLQTLWKRLRAECPWQLKPDQREELLLEWLKKSVPHAENIVSRTHKA